MYSTPFSNVERRGTPPQPEAAVSKKAKVKRQNRALTARRPMAVLLLTFDFILLPSVGIADG
jgi:hypothetical protein